MGRANTGIKMESAQGCQIRKFLSFQIHKIDDLFLASDSKLAFMIMPGFIGHINSWLAIARDEKIDTLEQLNGYNFPIRQP